jgi:hypothetical protein
MLFSSSLCGRSETGSVLARITHDGSSRNSGVATRDGRVAAREAEAYLKEYVEGLNGEHARWHAGCRSSESAIVAEALMNSPG